MLWTLLGLLMVAFAVVLMGSTLALLLITFYLAWTNPEKLREFQRNVVSKWPGYELLPNNHFDSPLTKGKLWATRMVTGLILLAVTAWIVIIISISSQ